MAPCADRIMEAQRVIEFWFEQTQPKQWWREDAAFDRRIAAEFGALHATAVQGALQAWRGALLGRLAEVIVLDQFSRNLYRNTARAFAADPLALALAQEAVATQPVAALAPHYRQFLYMPYMHSESAAVHAIALRLFSEPGLEASLPSERRHQAIIERFGRYPHRNAALGRASTPEELAFLEGGHAPIQGAAAPGTA
jgi:uncharacterized protein (DUF924 family)